MTTAHFWTCATNWVLAKALEAYLLLFSRRKRANLKTYSMPKRNPQSDTRIVEVIAMSGFDRVN